MRRHKSDQDVLDDSIELTYRIKDRNGAFKGGQLSTNSSSNSSVYVKVISNQAVQMIVLLNDNGDPTYEFEFQHINSLYVLDDSTVRIKQVCSKNGKTTTTKCTFSFTSSSDLEEFVSESFKIYPQLENVVFWKGKGEGSNKKLLFRGGSSSKLLSRGGSNSKLLRGDSSSDIEEIIEVTGDLKEQEDEQVKQRARSSVYTDRVENNTKKEKAEEEDNSSGEDEDEDDEEDDDEEDEEESEEKQSITKLKTENKETSKRKSRIQRRKSALESLNESEWVKYPVLRYNRFGQIEACNCMVSLQHRFFHIVSSKTGESISAYDLSELNGWSQHGGLSGRELSLTFRETQNGRKHIDTMRKKLNLDDQVESEDKQFNDESSRKTFRGSNLRRISKGRISTARSSRKQRKQTMGTGFFTNRVKGSKMKGNEATEIMENIVFQSHEKMKLFCRYVKKFCVHLDTIVYSKLGHADMCGGWFIFNGVLHDKKQRNRTLAIHPLLGCMFIFKTKQLSYDSLIRDSNIPVIVHRFCMLGNLRALTIAKHPTHVEFDFTSVESTEGEMGLNLQGSFDPVRLGLKTSASNDSPWIAPGLEFSKSAQAWKGKPVKMIFDFKETAETNKFLSCINSIRMIGLKEDSKKKSSFSFGKRNHNTFTQKTKKHESLLIKANTAPEQSSLEDRKTTTTTGRRKTSFSSKLLRKSMHKRFSQDNGEEGKRKQIAGFVQTLNAADLQYDAWSTDKSWFTSDHRIYIGTFNVGDSSPPKSSILEHWIPYPDDQTPSGIRVGKKCATTSSSGASGRYQIYAIGLQEVSTKFEDWSRAIAAHLGSDYSCAVSVRMWEIGLIVFIQKDQMEFISHPVNAAEKTGIRIAKAVTGVQLGNKGGVGVGFRWRDVPIAFINAHLSAQQNKVSERNLNYQQIMQKLCLGGSPGRVESFEFEPTLCFEHVFFLGDLNYRVDLDFKQAERAVQHENWELLHVHDQLEKERKAGRAFYGFQSELPHFTPTYRWKRNKHELSNKKEQPPSYTDRILWHSRSGSEDALKLETYGCSKHVMVSDHRPVCAGFSFSLRHEYSWPHHPLTTSLNSNSSDSMSLKQNSTPLPLSRRKTTKASIKNKSSSGNLEGGWTSLDGSFFIPKSSCQNFDFVPEIKLKNVVVHLHGQDSGQPLPPWIKLSITSPILQNIECSTYAPGTEVKPEMQIGRTSRYAYEGVGRWGDLYYKLDNTFGLPKLVPTLWDPLYLRTQHLLVQVVLPAQKEEGVLSTMHSVANPDGELEDENGGNVGKSKISSSQHGQICLSLRHAVDAVVHVVASKKGFSGWNEVRSPIVPFSEPIIQQGLEIGRLTGEIVLLPGRQSINRLLDETMVSKHQKRARNFKTGWVQLMVKNNRFRTSARVFLILNSDGNTFALSTKPTNGSSSTPTNKKLSVVPDQNLLFAFSVLNTEIDDKETKSFVLENVRELGRDQSNPVNISFTCENKADKMNWINAIDNVIEKNHNLALEQKNRQDDLPPPPEDYEEDEEYEYQEEKHISSNADENNVVNIENMAQPSSSGRGSEIFLDTPLPPPPPRPSQVFELSTEGGEKKVALDIGALFTKAVGQLNDGNTNSSKRRTRGTRKKIPPPPPLPLPEE